MANDQHQANQLQPIPDEDRFFIRDNGNILWMHYNPDSESGGQFVCAELTPDDIIKSALLITDAPRFFEAINEQSHLALIDKDSPDFGEALRAFEQTAFLTIPAGEYSQDARGALLSTAWKMDVEQQLQARAASNHEGVYLVEDTAYLHVQATDEGFDYTFYDKKTLAEQDGGVLEASDLTLYDAVHDILGEQRLGNSERVSLSIMEAIHKQQEMDFENGALLHAPYDAYAIYQLREDDALHCYRYESMKGLEAQGLSVEYDHYHNVYTAPLETDGDTQKRLESLFVQYNDYDAMPYDFKGHSLSTSDVIALKQNGTVTCHYVDSFGYVELPGFLSAKNPLRTVEDAIEQNDNQLDGIINNTPAPTVAELEEQVKSGQSISLMDLARATHREEKSSIREQLKQQPSQQEHKKTVPGKKTEVDR